MNLCLPNISLKLFVHSARKKKILLNERFGIIQSLFSVSKISDFQKNVKKDTDNNHENRQDMAQCHPVS